MSVLGNAIVKYNGLSGGGDGKDRRYKIVYLVQCSDASDGALTVCNAPGIARPFSHYATANEYDVAAVAGDADAKPIGKTADGRFIWEVTVDFSTSSEDPEKRDKNKSPLDWPLEIDGDGEQYMDYPESDRDEKVFENKAGEPFSSEVRATPKTYAIVNITKRQEANPLPIALYYQDTVNNAPYYGAEAGTLKLAKVKWSRKFEQGIYFYQVTYVFHYRHPIPHTDPSDGQTYPTEHTWYRRVLNAGEYYLKFHSTGDGGDGKTHKHYNAVNGMPTKSPFKLAYDGTLLPDGGTPIFLAFRVYRWVDFHNLNL
jgi:hypothetical protein